MDTPDNAQMPGCLLLIFVILALFQIISAVNVLQLPAGLAADVAFPPILQAIFAMIWALLFTLTIVRVVRGKRYRLGYSGLLLLGFIAYSAGRLLIFAQADYDRGRWPVLLVIVILSAVPVLHLSRAIWRVERD